MRAMRAINAKRQMGEDTTESNVCLQDEAYGTATSGAAAATMEHRKQQMGKAPAEAVGTSTPAVEQRQ